MAELNAAVANAIKAGHLVRILGDAEARELIAKAKPRFIEGNPRVWWLMPRFRPERFYYRDNTALENLRSHLSAAADPHYLVIETGEAHLPVIELPLAAIQLVLGELPFVEYCVLDASLSRLAMEDDHGCLHVMEFGTLKKSENNDDGG